jgi:hypothetical protein
MTRRWREPVSNPRSLSSIVVDPRRWRGNRGRPCERPFLHGGTDGSNPAPSSGESRANLTWTAHSRSAPSASIQGPWGAPPSLTLPEGVRPALNGDDRRSRRQDALQALPSLAEWQRVAREGRRPRRRAAVRPARGRRRAASRSRRPRSPTRQPRDVTARQRRCERRHED